MGEPPTTAQILDLLDQGVAQAVEAKEWELAARLMPAGFLRPYEAVLGRAVALSDLSRESLNQVRVALGGEALPDPADQPPVRPDE
jgi:hypothetical protein